MCRLITDNVGRYVLALAKKTLAMLFCCVSGCCSEEECIDEAGVTDGRSVSIRFYCTAEGGTKSWCDVDECNVGDVNVYAYNGGKLAAEVWCGDYGETGGELRLNLNAGMSYDIYALANVGRMHAPEDLATLKSLRLPVTTDISGQEYADDGAHGRLLPMACIPEEPLKVTPMRTGVALKLVRLVSRINFSFDDKSLKHSAVEITSVRVKQAATDVTAFEAGGKAIVARDGDLACRDDLDILNGLEGGSTAAGADSPQGSGTVSFYVPENCRGVLLPDNTDHWAKIPDNLPPEERALCTYLEIRGKYSSPGVIGENLTYRLYLGGDNCTDFSLKRNRTYSVTLTATDEGVFRTSWKVELGEYDDCRELRFDRDTLVLWQGGGAGNARIVCNPSTVEYSLSVDEEALRAAAIKWERDADILELSSSFTGDETKWAKMFLSSWDGLHRDTLTIKLDYVPGEFSDYVNRAPRYCGQWGTLEFPAVSGGHHVTVSSLGRTLEIGSAREQWVILRMPGNNGCLNLCYAPSAPQTLFIMAEDSGELPPISLSSGTLRCDLKLPDIIYPSYALRLSRDLCESGDIETDERDGFKYDADVSVVLADSKGNTLNLDTFATPDIFVTADMEEDPSNYLDEKYNDMCYRFIDRAKVEIIQGSDAAGFRIKRSGIDEAVYGRLAHWQMWGLKADEDRPATAVVRISNGYYPDGNMTSDIPVSVQPVFGNWRWLGSVTDWQLAPDSRRSPFGRLETESIRPYCGGGVSWDTRRSAFETWVRPDESLWNTAEPNYGVSFSPSGISFSDSDADFLSHGGAFIARGSTTNPHTGRTICGYYSFDSVLYLPIGVQVSLEGVGSNATIIHYAFCPFTQMAGAEWYGSWRWLEELTELRCLEWTTTGLRSANSRLVIPEEGDNGSYPLEFRSEVQRLDNTSSFKAINLFLSSFASTFFTFEFEVNGKTYTSLDFTREGYSSYFSGSELKSRESGSYGFYLLRRQEDEATIPGNYAYGLENHLLEAWLQSYSLH